MSAEHGQLQQSGGRRGRSPGDKKSRRRSRRKETYSMYIYKVLKQVSMGGPPWAWGGGWRKPGKGLDGVHSLHRGPRGLSSSQRPREAAPCLSCACNRQEAIQTCSHPGPEATGLWDRQNSHVGP